MDFFTKLILVALLALSTWGGYNHYKKREAFSTSIEKVRVSPEEKQNQVKKEMSQPSQNVPVHRPRPDNYNQSRRPRPSQNLGNNQDYNQPILDDNHNYQGYDERNELVEESPDEDNPNDPKNAEPTELVSCQTQIRNCEPKDEQNFDNGETPTFCITYAQNCLSRDSIQKKWREEDVFKPPMEQPHESEYVEPEQFNDINEDHQPMMEPRTFEQPLNEGNMYNFNNNEEQPHKDSFNDSYQDHHPEENNYDNNNIQDDGNYNEPNYNESYDDNNY